MPRRWLRHGVDDRISVIGSHTKIGLPRRVPRTGLGSLHMFSIAWTGCWPGVCYWTGDIIEAGAISISASSPIRVIQGRFRRGHATGRRKPPRCRPTVL